MNYLRQNAYPGVNIVGDGTAVGKAQVVFAFGRMHEKTLTCRQRYSFLESQALYFLRKDLLWQTEPDEKAARRVGPPHIRRHILAQSGERYVTAPFVECLQVHNVLLPMTAPAVLCNHIGHERVRATSHLHRPAVDAALDDILGTDQPSQSQSRRKRFRETANAHRVVPIGQGIEAGRHCTLKREVAIDII